MAKAISFVRIAEQKMVKKRFLRLFNDNQRHPRETEITAMLKRFVAKAPMVAFSTDTVHGVLIIMEDVVSIYLRKIYGSVIHC